MRRYQKDYVPSVRWGYDRDNGRRGSYFRDGGEAEVYWLRMVATAAEQTLEMVIEKVLWVRP